MRRILFYSSCLLMLSDLLSGCHGYYAEKRIALSQKLIQAKPVIRFRSEIPQEGIEAGYTHLVVPVPVLDQTIHLTTNLVNLVRKEEKKERVKPIRKALANFNFAQHFDMQIRQSMTTMKWADFKWMPADKKDFVQDKNDLFMTLYTWYGLSSDFTHLQVATIVVINKIVGERESHLNWSYSTNNRGYYKFKKVFQNAYLYLSPAKPRAVRTKEEIEEIFH